MNGYYGEILVTLCITTIVYFVGEIIHKYK